MYHWNGFFYVSYHYDQDYRFIQNGFETILRRNSVQNTYSGDDNSAEKIPSFLSPGYDDYIHSDNKTNNKLDDAAYISSIHT